VSGGCCHVTACLVLHLLPTVAPVLSVTPREVPDAQDWGFHRSPSCPAPDWVMGWALATRPCRHPPRGTLSILGAQPRGATGPHGALINPCQYTTETYFQIADLSLELHVLTVPAFALKLKLHKYRLICCKQKVKS